MPKKYIFTEAQIEEINNVLSSCKKADEYKRIQCLKLKYENKLKLYQIAELTGYNPKYVSRLIVKYFNTGIESLLNRKREANRRHLSFRDEEEFLSSFKNKAENGQMLVVEDIRKAYSEKVGKETSKNGIYKVLARHGWRKIMPRSKHPNKAKPEAIEAYKKNN